MTLDQAQRRDTRIAALDAKGRGARTPAEQEELGRLVASRDHFWWRLGRQHSRTIAKLRHLEALAAQAGFTFTHPERIL